MRTWISAVVLVAAVFFVAAPKLWSQEARIAEQPAGAAAAAAPATLALAVHAPPTQYASEASALAHRPAVLERFACGDCHGIESGYVMPADHTLIPENECRDCHRVTSGPPPIALHDTMGHESAAVKDCGLCHRQFAEPLRRAPVEQTLCVRCHAADEEPSVLPASHEGRSDAPATCIVCHDTVRLEKPAVPHDVEGWQQCSFCHGPGRLTPLGGAHDAQAAAQCVSCHGVVQPPGTYSRMHTLATEAEGCVSCHATGALAPLPASHDGRSELLCVLCHRPSSDEPPLAPHALTNDGLCTTCHAEGALGSLPFGHATREDEMCTTCHTTPAAAAAPMAHDFGNRTICTSCHAPSAGPAGQLLSGIPSLPQ
ncbi:MAG: hypothetical protein HY874_02600 [Chloroflexi bacterium]|nr:hypothetical protein [Chloroflexota bacterium]